MDWQALAQGVLSGRPELFAHDYEACRQQLHDELAGRTVCVIGAGGSIGRATAEALLEQRPKRTLLVDLSENNLAEVTRRLRNRLGSAAPDFECWALDYTREPFYALLERERPSIIMNFAAFKHVRSEKDHLTLAEMIRVNVLGNMRLLEWAQAYPLRRFFVISTDKAANPASCMGATKRLMEQVIFAACGDAARAAEYITTTRFANVLFSDGSLPASFVQRFEQRQPLSGPSDIKRYFITPREAARLCLLAACHDRSGEFLVPKMRESDMLGFDVLAERFLTLHNLVPRHYGPDTAAAIANLEADYQQGAWPCLFSPSETSGEKEIEEFTEAAETQSASQPYREVSCIVPLAAEEWTAASIALREFSAQICDPGWLRKAQKADVVRWLADNVPSFRHIETQFNLDRKI